MTNINDLAKDLYDGSFTIESVENKRSRVNQPRPLYNLNPKVVDKVFEIVYKYCYKRVRSFFSLMADDDVDELVQRMVVQIHLWARIYPPYKSQLLFAQALSRWTTQCITNFGKEYSRYKAKSTSIDIAMNLLDYSPEATASVSIIRASISDPTLLSFFDTLHKCEGDLQQTAITLNFTPARTHYYMSKLRSQLRSSNDFV